MSPIPRELRLPDKLDLAGAIEIEQALLRGGESQAISEALLREFRNPSRPWRERRVFGFILGRAGGDASRRRLLDDFNADDSQALFATVLAVSVRGISQPEFRADRERALLKEFVDGMLGEEALSPHHLKWYAPWLPEYRASYERASKLPLRPEPNPLSQELGRLTGQEAARLLQALSSELDPTTRVGVLSYVNPADDAVFSTVKNLIGALDADSASEAAALLGTRVDFSGAEALLTLLQQDGRNSVRRALLGALPRFGNFENVQIWALGALRGGEPAIQEAAVAVALKADTPQAWNAVKQAFGSGHEEFRLHVLRSLGSPASHSRDTIEAIVRSALEDTSESVRLTALVVLNRLPGPSVRPVFERLANADPSETVRKSAARYLDQLPNR
jgi:hypothetical protein